MRNYEFTTIKNGKLVTTNELKDHRRNKFVESWFSNDEKYFQQRLSKLLEINPNSIFKSLQQG